MALVTVAESCTGCGTCVAVCPAGCLAMAAEGPRTVSGASRACIQCGHCVAVCPRGALTHDVMAPAECAPLPADWRLTPEAVSGLLTGRRSIRNFEERPVDRAVLAQLLDVARYAPTAKNAQSAQWLVITNPAEVQEVSCAVIDWMRGQLAERAPAARVMRYTHLIEAHDAGRDPICRYAPHLVIAHAPTADPFATCACLLALSYLELAALPHGLGTCFAGYVHMAAVNAPEVQALLDLPEGHACFGGVLLGYPQYAYARRPARNPAEVIWR